MSLKRQTRNFRESFFGVLRCKKEGGDKTVIKRAIRWGVLSLLLTLLIGMLLWAQFNKVDDPKLARSIYDRTLERLKSQAQVPPHENGFTLLTSLCSAEDPQDAKRNQLPFRALRNYIDPDDWLRSFRKNPGQAARDVARFESIVPVLSEATAKKQFLCDFDRGAGGVGAMDVKPRGPNLRNLVRGLRTCGCYYEFKGDRQKAGERYLLGIELCNKYGKTGPELQRFTCSVTQQTVARPLLQLLGDNRFPATYYRHIIQRVEALPGVPSDALDGFDESYVMGVDFFDDLQSGKITAQQVLDCYASVSVEVSQTRRYLLRFPPYIAHEKTVFQNLCLRRRPYVERLVPPPDSVASAEKENLEWHWLASDNLPYGIITAHTNSMADLSAISVLAALQAYHSERKVYPPALDSLVPEYLKQLPRNYRSQDGAFRYARKDHSFRLEAPSDAKNKKYAKTVSYYPPRFSD